MSMDMLALSLYFLIGILSADDTLAPTCGELSQIVQKMEVELMGHSLETCTGVTLEGEFDAAVLSEARCKSLGAIEAELKNLELERVVLDGFNKMKTDLNRFHQEAGDSNRSTAQAAGSQFVTTLRVAQSFEALLATKDKQNAPLLMALKDDSPFESVDVLKRKVSDLCQVEEALNACSGENVFNPTPEVLVEINGFLNPNLTPEMLEGWRSELAIRRKSNEEPWTFLAMRADLEASFGQISQGDFALTRAQLKAITDLDYISTSSGPFRNLLAAGQTAFAPQREMERYKFLLQDTKARQAAEVQSKVSLLFQSYFAGKTYLSESEVLTCSEAKLNYEKATLCMTVLEAKKTHFQGSDKARIEETLLALTTSKNYHTKLNSAEGNCISAGVLNQVRQTGNLPTSCEEVFGAGTANIALRYSTLSQLREKILSEKKRLADFRQLAYQHMQRNRCFTNSLSTDIECSVDFPFAQEALVLSNDTLAISLVLAKPKVDEALINIEAYCQEPDGPVGSNEQSICAIGSGNGPGDVLEPETRAEEFMAPTDPGSRNIVGEAYKEALISTVTHLAQTLGNHYRQQQTPPNPYGRVNPYGNGGPVMSISGAIQMGAARREMFHQQTQGRYMGF